MNHLRNQEIIPIKLKKMYKGKTVLITGSSRGIGKSIADHFCDNRADVLEIHKTGGVDLSDPNQIVQYFENNRDQKIDILINNAAVPTSHYAVRIPLAEAIEMVMVDFMAVFLVTRECLRLMRNPTGRVINISSMAVALEPMGDSLYAACKAGITKMNNIIAKEVAFGGITFNTLAISAIETDMLKQLKKDKIDKVVKELPIPRYAKMEDIMNVIDFFASPKSDYITAQTIYLGGVHE